MRPSQQLLSVDIDRSYYVLKDVAKEFKSGMLEKGDLCSIFFDWASDDMDMVMRREHPVSKQVHYGSMMLAKRGNAKYEYRVKKQIEPLLSLVKEHGYNIFEDDDDTILNGATSTARTNVIWITLTVDPSLYKWYEAWGGISRWWNQFKLDFARMNHTSIDAARVWEAQESGYPHIHAIIFCHDVDFTVFKWQQKTKSGNKEFVYRLQERRFRGEDGKLHDWNDPIIPVREVDPKTNRLKRNGRIIGYRSIWPYGNFDVQGVQNTAKKVDYLFKYATKSILNVRALQGNEDFGKLLLTMACLWAAQKRAFAANVQFWYSCVAGMRLPQGRIETIGNVTFDYSEKLSWREVQETYTENDILGECIVKRRIVKVQVRHYRLELTTHNSTKETDMATMYNIVPMCPIRHQACFAAARDEKKNVNDYKYDDIDIQRLDEHSKRVLEHCDNGDIFKHDLAVLEGEESPDLPQGLSDDQRHSIAINGRRLMGWPEL